MLLENGVTKVTACGRTLIRSSKMEAGLHGANMARAHVLVELGFASELDSATTQRPPTAAKTALE